LGKVEPKLLRKKSGTFAPLFQKWIF